MRRARLGDCRRRNRPETSKPMKREMGPDPVTGTVHPTSTPRKKRGRPRNSSKELLLLWSESKPEQREERNKLRRAASLRTGPAARAVERTTSTPASTLFICQRKKSTGRQRTYNTRCCEFQSKKAIEVVSTPSYCPRRTTSLERTSARHRLTRRRDCKAGELTQFHTAHVDRQAIVQNIVPAIQRLQG